MLVYLQMIETAEDRSKFEAIYLEYRDLMYRVAYKYLHQEQDAEDATHQAFEKIAKNIKIIEPVCPKTRSLVVIIVERCSIDLLRSRKRHPEVELNDGIAQNDPALLSAESLLASCIQKLPEQQRQVIVLKYHHGYTLKEIARLLGRTLTWAQKTDQRAKKALEALYLEGGGTL